MFAQAMSSTTPVIAKRRMSGMRASPWAELCPRSPGSSTTSFERKFASTCSGIPCCSGASTSFRIGR